MHTPGTVYATTTSITTSSTQRLYQQVVGAATDLRGQLQTLAQLGRAMDPATVEAVRGLVFAAHGWR